MTWGACTRCFEQEVDAARRVSWMGRLGWRARRKKIGSYMILASTGILDKVSQSVRST